MTSIHPKELDDPKSFCLWDSLDQAVNVFEDCPSQPKVERALKALNHKESPGFDKVPLEGLKFCRSSSRLMVDLIHLGQLAQLVSASDISVRYSLTMGSHL